MKEDILKWTYIPQREITVDLTAGGDEGFHAAIREALGFPLYYGKNWDAYWDLMWEFSVGYPEGKTIIFRGIETLDDWNAERLQTVSGWVEEEYPHIRIIFQ